MQTMARAKKETVKKEATFEKDLEQLEAIVAALEEGGLSLDESLKRFEEGVKLSRSCEKALTDAEKRIEILLKNTQGALEARELVEEKEEKEEDKEEEEEEAQEEVDTDEPVPSAPKESRSTQEDLPF
ncbi:MAG TPA: exodeoxyribonuclease VII small subunit [Candidatus Hydrogenedentes bacterium]|nr:exodeoxyribonuclease VII small subunit [Candidatus Hydrogenedentota bacterium]